MFTARALAQPFHDLDALAGRVWRLSDTVPWCSRATGKTLPSCSSRTASRASHGAKTPLPDGRTSREHVARLRKLESEAKAAKRGGWAPALRGRTFFARQRGGPAARFTIGTLCVITVSVTIWR